MREKDYINAVNKIAIPKDMEVRIMRRCRESKGKNVFARKRRYAVIMAAAVMAVGLTSFAVAGGHIASISGGSNSFYDYRKLPTAEICLKDVGFEPILIDDLGFGYTFKGGNKVKSALNYENGNKEKFNELSLEYSNGDDNISLYEYKKQYSADISENAELVYSDESKEMYYVSCKQKNVPADYELTDKDRQAIDNGEYVMGYGTDDIETVNISHVIWTDDTLAYDLLQIDGKLAKEQLIDMAINIAEK